MSFVTHIILDRSAEVSFTRHYLPTINAGNYTAVTGNTVGQNVGNLRLALAAVILGNFVRHEVTAQEAVFPTTPATSEFAQRETKLLVRYVSTANRRGSLEIPGPNLTLLAQPNTDEIDMSVTEFQDFKDLLESDFRDSYGDTVTVTDARIVGRRL